MSLLLEGANVGTGGSLRFTLMPTNSGDLSTGFKGSPSLFHYVSLFFFLELVELKKKKKKKQKRCVGQGCSALPAIAAAPRPAALPGIVAAAPLRVVLLGIAAATS